MPKAMADETFNPRSQDRQPGAARGGRGGTGRDQGGREPGGFRIRLSDNEMRAARAVQEAFGLRSTVAALGMALRTTAQLLEEGKLDEQVAQQRSQAPARGDGPRGEGSRGDGPRGDGPRGGGRRDGRGDGRQERAPRVDPFARPSRPAPVVSEPVVSDASADDAAPMEAAEEGTTPMESTEVQATEVQATEAQSSEVEAPAAQVSAAEGATTDAPAEAAAEG